MDVSAGESSTGEIGFSEFCDAENPSERPVK